LKQDRVVEKARKILKGMEKNITMISCSLGFPSSQHFATAFKKFEDMPPSLYRKRSGEKEAL